jgi:2-keto-4-pentenoate hydratase/2-oxohepta-3-ene-1,7-dioic acid hydratase in catechol pathway
VPEDLRRFRYEGERALVIGKPSRHVAKADALSHVFGYTLFNDGSIRDIQFKHSIGSSPPRGSTCSQGCRDERI